MQIGVPKETREGEARVALVPESVGRLKKVGLDIVVQTGAGEAAGFSDQAYQTAGAMLQPDADVVFGTSDIVAKVRPPVFEGGPSEIAKLKAGAVLIGMLEPLTSPKLLQSLAEHDITALSMELIPRITRAQSMDVLSSQATVAGYKAVLLGAATSPKLFPMLMTAAGTIPPARVLVLGAGVAGLQAIATAKRLGAIVEGYDVRPEVKDQVESLGAKWVGLAMEEAVGAGGYAKEVSEDAQRRALQHLSRLVADADVVITTAAIPGRRSPVLVTDDMVMNMKRGAVIVDLAAEGGGNCTMTQAGKTIDVNGVHILGPLNLAASMPFHASQMYSRNLTTLLQHLIKEGALNLDTSDEITVGCLVTHGGEIVHPRLRPAVAAAP